VKYASVFAVHDVFVTNNIKHKRDSCYVGLLPAVSLGLMLWFYFMIRNFQRNIYIHVNLRCLNYYYRYRITVS